MSIYQVSSQSTLGQISSRGTYVVQTLYIFGKMSVDAWIKRYVKKPTCESLCQLQEISKNAFRLHIFIFKS